MRVTRLAGTVALCIAFEPCAGLTPEQITAKIVADASAYNQAVADYGFQVIRSGQSAEATSAI